MKFYGEQTKLIYDSAEECEKAEREFTEKLEAKKKAEVEKVNARKIAAEKVEAARKVAVEANKAYREELTKFCKDYGVYHNSWSSGDVDNLFDWFMNL